MRIQIGVGELRTLCQSAQPPLLLDVREPWEAQLASIRVDGVRSLLMPMGQVSARFEELDPTQPVVCYCHHGVRSLQVVAFLQRAGFESVYNLAGGIDAWSNEVDPAVPRY
ncbi:rhodanese-like domain-containing protein [Paucibacter sp. AS339]|uniref:rhodanese-like domain-containing protein n=1 Tax=Paucibacter hankyongi TaxID=3133434 RepID=UPI0030A36BBD